MSETYSPDCVCNRCLWCHLKILEKNVNELSEQIQILIENFKSKSYNTHIEM